MKQLGDISIPPSIRTRPGWLAEPLPLVVFPFRGQAGGSDRAASLRACAERYLPRLGSILFRGFQVYEPDEFEHFVRMFGAAVTRVHAGSIWGEMGGGRLWVGCSSSPESCAEATIADNHEIYAALSIATRTSLIQRGLRYVLTLGAEAESGWQHVFQTTDRSQVEAWCHAHDTSFAWRPEGAVRLERVGAVVSRHPTTGEVRWADAGPLLHHACGAAPDADEHTPAFQALYANGSPIEAERIADIVSAFTACASRVEWEAGDVLVVDRATATACIPAAQRRELRFAIAALSRLS